MALTFTAEETAQALVEQSFPVSKYKKNVQDRRVERMKLWKERGVKALIEHEQELIEHGEKVIALMEAAYLKRTINGLLNDNLN